MIQIKPMIPKRHNSSKCLDRIDLISTAYMWSDYKLIVFRSQFVVAIVAFAGQNTSDSNRCSEFTWIN